jgi:hypothetical protein
MTMNDPGVVASHSPLYQRYEHQVVINNVEIAVEISRHIQAHFFNLLAN